MFFCHHFLVSYIGYSVRFLLFFIESPVIASGSPILELFCLPIKINGHIFFPIISSCTNFKGYTNKALYMCPQVLVPGLRLLPCLHGFRLKGSANPNFENSPQGWTLVRLSKKPRRWVLCLLVLSIDQAPGLFLHRRVVGGSKQLAIEIVISIVP